MIKWFNRWLEKKVARYCDKYLRALKEEKRILTEEIKEKDEKIEALQNVNEALKAVNAELAERLKIIKELFMELKNESGQV